MSAERWVALFIAFAAGTAGCVADQSEKARILARLTGAAQCKFGDCDAIGEGVSEMRINGGRDTGSIFSPRRAVQTWRPATVACAELSFPIVIRPNSVRVTVPPIEHLRAQ